MTYFHCSITQYFYLSFYGTLASLDEKLVPVNIFPF